jgi:NlpC/P60 family putative phage cell wall peptidase
MTTRADVVAEARTWIGTPWQHQAHAKGIGADCAGLIGGVAVALGLVPADWWDTAAAPHAGYSRQPSGDGLLRVLDRFMLRISTAAVQPGDVAVMRFRRDPQHLGIVVPYAAGGLALVHAMNGGAVREVSEHRIDERWYARMMHAYALPGVS